MKAVRSRDRPSASSSSVDLFSAAWGATVCLLLDLDSQVGERAFADLRLYRRRWIELLSELVPQEQSQPARS